MTRRCQNCLGPNVGCASHCQDEEDEDEKQDKMLSVCQGPSIGCISSCQVWGLKLYDTTGCTEGFRVHGVLLGSASKHKPYTQSCALYKTGQSGISCRSCIAPLQDLLVAMLLIWRLFWCTKRFELMSGQCRTLLTAMAETNY